MALAAVPRSVLNKIQQLIFEFHWFGGGSTQHYHLCCWEAISKPKLYGAWGLRNLFHFNLALATNSLWRVLTKQGIWHKVIKDKYLPYTSITTWLRWATTAQPLASQTWKNLTKSLLLITHWLSWFPGNDQSIILGQDNIHGNILGNGTLSLLSLDLLVKIEILDTSIKPGFKIFGVYILINGKVARIWAYRVLLHLSGAPSVIFLCVQGSTFNIVKISLSRPAVITRAASLSKMFI